MTDKQIIIDGIDVSGCVSFDKLNGQNICCYDDTREDKIPFANFCVENKNCNFKQLKRKEQKLAKALACIDKCVSDFYHEIGTPYYEELLKSAKELGLIAEAKDE